MQENNRECLKWVFQTVKFLAGQGLACRGKTDEERNFRKALNMLIESHNKECDLHENHEHTSNLVQN